ncbi:MAG: TIM barrel protein [Bryobacterales bacterium]|nr:TIM barrel protein [Bryobacterales bacterium]
MVMRMRRRELLKSGAAVLLAGWARPAFTQAKSSGKFSLDVYSRSLQWLRTPAEVAKAVTEIGLNSVDLTVMPYPGHVDPAKVKTDLPRFVKDLGDGGITVSAITCPITDADSSDAEAIIGTASSAGIRYYSWGGFRYDDKKPYQVQLDALKPRVERLARLNEKHNIKALYQPRAGAMNIGTAFFDLLDVLKEFDPRFVAFRYDTGSLVQTTPDLQALQLRQGGRYIGGIALNDAAVKLDLPVWHQGAYQGTPEQQIGASSGGDNTGKDGGNPLALGGGGRPLPYHVHPVPVGTGMIDLTLIGKTLKEIGFEGPAECQAEWPLGGAEIGNDKITLPRQTVLGQIKHNRLMVEQAFAPAWNINIAQPPFMQRGAKTASGPDPEQ